MELNFFKDILFDLLNESDNLNIADMEADDGKNILIVKTTDGNIIEIECRKIK